MTIHDYEKSIKKFGLLLTAAYTIILIATKLVHVGESTGEWNTAYSLATKHERQIDSAGKAHQIVHRNDEHLFGILFTRVDTLKKKHN